MAVSAAGNIMGGRSTGFSEDEYQVSSGTAAQVTNGQGFVTGHDFSRANCSGMRDGLQPLLSFHSEICVCSGEKQAAERGDARLLWQGDGVLGLKPDPLFLLLLWPG